MLKPWRFPGSVAILVALASSSCFLPVTRGDPPGIRRGQNGKVAGSSAPKPLRFLQSIPGDSKPLRLDADQIVTWAEQGQRVVVLNGFVLIHQGALQLRCQQAVVFLDQAQRRRTGIFAAAIYAEGKVHLDDPGATRRGNQAIGEIQTRGEVKLTAHRQSVTQQPARGAAVYQRASSALKARLEAARVTKPRPTGGTEASEAPKVPGATLLPPTPPTPQGLKPRSPARPLPATRKTEKPLSNGSRAPVKPTQFTPPPPPPPPGSTVPEGSTGAVPPVNGQNPPRAGSSPAPSGGPVLRATPLLRYTLAPRVGSTFKTRSSTGPNGEQVTIVTGGVVVQVSGLSGTGMLDIEADNVVIWSKGVTGRQLIQDMQGPDGKATRELEFYFNGRVELRQKTGPDSRTLRAEEVYYDANRNVALAANADLEIVRADLEYPLHVKAQELRQLSRTKYEVIEAEIFASKLPSDPGLRVLISDATLEQRQVPRRSIFGRQVVDRKTGQPLFVEELLTKGRNAVVKVGGVPVFYTPFFQGDARDPLGPLESIRFGYNQIFGFQLGASFNVYDLLGIVPFAGTRWTVDLDYLSDRGPALGTNFDYNSPTFLGLPARLTGGVKAWGIIDNGEDILARPDIFGHPTARGRFRWWQNIQDLPNGFTAQTQLVGLSDRNVYEQFYKLEFDHSIDQSTFIYVKQQHGNMAWTGLVEPRFREWVTRTEWLPRIDGYIIGQSLFDLFTYHVHGSAAFAELEVSNDPFPEVSPTDVSVDTGRFDVYQEVGLPFQAGPFKIVPYGVLDLAYYTNDVTGSDRGRVYGGGGVRGSLPLTRLYPDVESLFFNVSGLNHKVTLGSDYFIAGSSESFLLFAQLDRLNDDATNRALREFTPAQPLFNPGFPATSPLFNPQTYAIRRRLDNRIETRDDIQVLQLNVRQRLQTKRGFPGRQHIVDWMTLDVSTSLFPAGGRDNFGEHWAFLEYDYVWNVGDRTSIVSSGWFDPFENGARVFTFGTALNRPDRTNLFLGYRQIDPLRSKAVTAVAQYVFSPKYAATFSTVYDFGIAENLSSSLVLTRMGTDLSVSLGITYSAILNNFGVTLTIIPNLLANRPGFALGQVSGFGSGTIGR